MKLTLYNRVSRQEFINFELYEIWNEIIELNSAAHQSLSIEEYNKILNNDQILKIKIESYENKPLGLLFVTKSPVNTLFYNLEYFTANIQKFNNILFIPRGGLALDPNYWENYSFLTLLRKKIQTMLKINEFVIDITNDGPIGPYNLFPLIECIDYMDGVGWEKDKCYLNYHFTENFQLINHEPKGIKDNFYDISWNVFLDGFDNSYLSACPPVFDEEYYKELYFNTMVTKIFLLKESIPVGAVIILPLEYIPFVNHEVIYKRFPNKKNYVFVLEMTIIKNYRGIKNLINLGRAFVNYIPNNTGIIMDHSRNINPGFIPAIQRTYKLKSEDILHIGTQKYAITKII